MKRFFAIFFALLYTLLTSGFTVNVHYCMGKLASVKLQNLPDEDQCKRCGRPVKSMDCCKNEVKFCKVTTSHQAAKALQQSAPVMMDLQLPVKILSTPAPLAALQLHQRSYPHDPPDIGTMPVFLRNCVFLI
ncbi:HYC_CC_PP family protein [Chitinophaga qingshengii]|uniref:Uncharacterized protein n=1 Tax=Chitinophaga qingshengii TaxID=1569794 RepID=A0ABR7TKF2_9BACT|nr:hypothetical protein [Chitinophaga qingshengii]MBC9930465.1 hypothetical protein [Chitinophaga qingshengii]